METKDLKFGELDEGFTIKEAIEEAKRCLNCKNPLCIKGCPIENNIPGFIHQLSMGNIGAAMHIINEKVIFRQYADEYVHTKNSVSVIVF